MSNFNNLGTGSGSSRRLLHVRAFTVRAGVTPDA